MASNVIGLDARLYYNSGTYASPVWTKVVNVRDVTLNLEAGEAEFTSRDSSGWRAHLPTLKSATVDFDLLWDTAAAGFSNLRDAFLNGTTVDVRVMDEDIAATGAQGMRAICSVTQWNRNEPLEEALTVSVSIKPAPNTSQVPSWDTIV